MLLKLSLWQAILTFQNSMSCPEVISISNTDIVMVANQQVFLNITWRIMSPYDEALKFYHSAFSAGKSFPYPNNHDWYIDSGCSDHLISNFSSLKDYKQTKGCDIKYIVGTAKVKGKGTVAKWSYTIKNASYVHGLPCKLFSVARMTSTSGEAYIYLLIQRFPPLPWLHRFFILLTVLIKIE